MSVGDYETFADDSDSLSMWIWDLLLFRSRLTRSSNITNIQAKTGTWIQHFSTGNQHTTTIQADGVKDVLSVLFLSRCSFFPTATSNILFL